MRVAIIAGESSGDQLGGSLLERLRQRCPDLEAEGIGGPAMRAQGCASLYPMERLSVMGLFESFGRYPELLPLRARLIRRYLNTPPDVFIGVDAPDFNLPIERRLRAAGVPTVHYVSPSVWAWRRYRVRKIAAAVDLMLVLFPFEAEFYARHGVPVEFVGHPLADAIPEVVDAAGARRSLGVAPEGEVVALLPGSRASEVRHLASPMIDTACWLARRKPELVFLVPLAHPDLRASFAETARRRGAGLALTLFDGRAREVMAAADVVLLASGTATLEAMLLKRPMVVTYKTGALSYAILERWVGANICHVGLPNLLAGRGIVPELLQDDAAPEALGAAVLRFLEDDSAVERLEREFRELHARLRCNAAERAARAIAALVERGA